MNEYEQKQERRKERFLELSDKATQEAESRSNAAHTLASCIPMGQPILVGHHSEKRHRRDLARIDNNTRKAIDESKKAEYYRERAASVGRAGISSDDPEAVQKLKEKLARLEVEQERMKAVNKAWRKAGKPKPDDVEGWQRVVECCAVALDSTEAAKIRVNMARDYMDRGPFPSYSTQNNNGNMARIRERIKALERQPTEAAEEREFEGLRVVDNAEENRLQLFFDGKPPQEQRQYLKSTGFRWSPSRGCWQAYRGAKANWHVEDFLKKYKE